MGLTETAAPILSNPMEPAKRKYGSVGTPVGNDVKIIDQDGNEVPRGTPGEIMVRGDNVPVLSFFRSNRFMGGPFVQLELELDEVSA